MAIRALAIKTAGRVLFRSRNDNDFSVSIRPSPRRWRLCRTRRSLTERWSRLMNPAGRHLINILQNYGSSIAPILYYVFDVLVLAGRDVMELSLSTRRDLLDRH